MTQKTYTTREGSKECRQRVWRVGFGPESSSVTCQNQRQFLRVSRSPGPTQQDCAQNRDNTEQMLLTDNSCSAAYTAASTKVTTLGGTELGPPYQTAPFLFPIRSPFLSAQFLTDYQLLKAKYEITGKCTRSQWREAAWGSHLPVFHSHQNARRSAKLVSTQSTNEWLTHCPCNVFWLVSYFSLVNVFL